MEVPIPAFAGHFGHRAAEVEVNVVGPVFFDQHPYCLPYGHRVDSVELNRPRCFIGFVVDDPHAFGAAFDQCAGGHHFGDVEASAVFAAQTAEGRVGDPSHGCQHNRGVNSMGPIESAGGAAGALGRSITTVTLLLSRGSQIG